MTDSPDDDFRTADGHRPLLRGPAWLWWMLALVVLLGLFAIDRAAYAVVHENWNYYSRPVPTLLKVPTRVMRSMEDWGENVFILCVLVVMWRLDRTRRSRVLCVVLAAVGVSLSVEGVKRLTGRERPQVSDGRMVLHGPATYDQGGDYQSFPSGHTASAASYSGSLAAFYPPARPVAIALAIGCGGNRIWKERHFLSDCWLGGVFGFWFAFTLPRRRFLRPLLAAFDRRFSVPQASAAPPAVPSAALAA